MKKSNQKMLTKKSHFQILAVVIAVITAFGGYFYYDHAIGELSRQKENELKAIAELKIDQLVQWHKERIADAKVVSGSKLFVKGIEEWLDNKRSKPLSQDILESLISAKANFGYESIFLTSPECELLLVTCTQMEVIDDTAKAKINESSKNGQISFTDFYYCETHKKIHYDIIAPIKNENNITIADLVFRVDPSDYIYPLIQSWPTPSKTAETLLFKRDGDSILYLNELRHTASTALQFRLPLSKKYLPSAQSIMGKTGIFIGKDYRDMEVLAWLSPVPGTDWFMVAKVDTAEIFADLYKMGIFITLFILFLILALSIGIIWIYHYRQRNIFRNLWQVQEEFKTTLYSIGDAVISTDVKGRIRSMNEIAENLTGWKEKNVIGKYSTEIFRIINEETRITVDSPVEKVLLEGKIVGLANHTLLIAKDGTEKPIADSGAPIKNQEGEIIGVVLVFRDQTEERLQQKIIETRLRLFEFSASHSLNEILIKTLDEVEMLTNSKIGFFHFVLPDEVTLHLQAWSTRTEELYCKAEGKGMEYNVNKAGAWADCIHMKEPVIHNDYASLHNKKGMPEGHAKVTRELVVPIIRNEKVVAVFGIGNKPGNYTEKDVEVADFIADVAWEIAQKKIKEEEKAESDRKFHSMVNNLDGVVYRCSNDPDWTMEYMSDSVFTLSGYPATDYLNNKMRTFDSIIHPADKKIVWDEVQTATELKAPYTIEYRIITAAGETKFVWESGQGVFEDDKLIALEGYITDITGRKLAEERELSRNQILTALATDASLPAILEMIVRSLEAENSETICSILLLDEQGQHLINGAAPSLPDFYNQAINGLKIGDGVGSCGTAAFTAKRVIVEDILDHPYWADFRELAQKANLRACWSEPILSASGKVLGTFALYHRKPYKAKPDDIERFQSITSFACLAIERRQAEEALRQSEENLSITLNSIGDGVIATNREGLVANLNPVAEKLCGWAEAVAIGKPLSEIFRIINSDTRETVANPVDLVMAKGEIIGMANHTVLISKSGDEYQIADSAAPIKTKEGEITGVVLVFSDVTEKYAREKALRDSERALSTLVGNLPGMAYRQAFDRDWTTFFISYSCFDITGYHPEDFINNNTIAFNDIIVEEFREPIWEKWQKVLAEKTSFEHEYQIRKADGEIRWVWERGLGVYDENENLLYLEGYIEDITNEKQAGEALQNSEELFRNLVENISDVFYISDKKGRLIYASPNFSTETGYLPQEITEMSYIRLIAPADRRKVVGYYLEKANSGVSDTSLEFRVMRKDTTIFYAEQTTRIVRDSSGNVVQYRNVIRNITERKEAEEALKESEFIYRTLVEKMPDGVYKTTHDGKVVEVNPAMLQILGYNSNEELVGIDIANELYFDPSDREQMTLEGMNNNLITYRLRKKDGSEVWVEDHGWYNYGEHGEILFHEGVIRDITDRKRAEEALQKSKDELMAFFEDDISADLISSPEGKLIYCNQTYLNLFGFKTLEEAKNFQIDKLYVNPPNREIFLEQLKRYKRLELIEDELITLDGRKITTIQNSTGVFDEAGNLVQIRSYLVDITKLKESEKEAKKLFRAIEQSPVSVVITDPDGKIEYINEQLSLLTGYAKEEVLGQNPNLFQSGQTGIKVYEELWGTILSGSNWAGELLNKKKNGELFWEQAIISPIVNDKGEITQFVAVKEDITAKKKMFDDLVIAKEKAQESDRLKSAFLANMSHEIRTPMNGILGFADLLKQDSLTGEEQQEYISIIEKSGARMLNIINDIVDISKIESGLVSVYETETNINEQLEYIYTFFKPEAESKGIQLFVKNTLMQNEASIKTDREKLYAILINLVKNAVKYTNEGVIEFGVSLDSPLEKSSTLKSELHFFVKDTGIGVPKDRQKAIFERFIQADIEDVKALQGAGLGLSITKSYIEMLGGKIWVDSEEGKGSTFYFTLPYKTVSLEKAVIKKIVKAEDEYYPPQPESGKLKVLIAEDDETSEMLLSLMVKMFAKELIKAKTGLEAVEICRNNPDIDLILMDIQMPEMSGYEASKQIRQFNKEVIIIAQTAYGLSGDKEKALNAGINDYISKPIKNDLLREILHKYFKK